MNYSQGKCPSIDGRYLLSRQPTSGIETILYPETQRKPQRSQNFRRAHNPDVRKTPNNLTSCTKNVNHLVPKENIVGAAMFMNFLQSHVLTPEQLYAHGYPMNVVDKQDSEVSFHSPNGMSKPSTHYVYASEIVPKKSCNSEANSLRESSGSESDTEKDKVMQQQCVRCCRGFLITKDEYLTHETCNYHWGKLQRDQTGFIFEYSCCKKPLWGKGCSTGRFHVWNGPKKPINDPCDGFVSTLEDKYAPPNHKYQAYGVDCEMCYTVAGLELTKVTVVDIYGRIVYNSFVKPKNQIIDYNTRYSGITAKNLKSPGAKTLEQVQSELRCFIKSRTILIGHGLENDLRSLKMIHHTVVDTACSFPHFKGLPFRHSLKQLVATYLNKDIQCSGNGHDSYEDATSPIELMRYKYENENLRVYN